MDANRKKAPKAEGPGGPVDAGAGAARAAQGAGGAAPELPPGTDVVVVRGANARGDGAEVVRFRPGRIDVGEVRPAAEGKPVTGEIVRLTRRDPDGDPRVLDVEVLHAPGAAASGDAPKATAKSGTDDVAGGAGAPGARGRPAQVATPAYRDNWETIFGARRKPGSSAPN